MCILDRMQLYMLDLGWAHATEDKRSRKKECESSSNKEGMSKPKCNVVASFHESGIKTKYNVLGALGIGTSFLPCFMSCVSSSILSVLSLAAITMNTGMGPMMMILLVPLIICLSSSVFVEHGSTTECERG
jgi:hypothetical protein